MGCNNSVGIATAYDLGNPSHDTQWARVFRTRPEVHPANSKINTVTTLKGV